MVDEALSDKQEREDAGRMHFTSEPLITVWEIDPDPSMYTVFSLVGDLEVIFNAAQHLVLAKWLEAHREQLEQEAKVLWTWREGGMQ